MEKVQYNFLVKAALLLSIAWIGWSIYDGAFREKIAGESAYHAGNKFFEDGLYSDALNSYQDALNKNTQFIDAKRTIIPIPTPSIIKIPVKRSSNISRNGVKTKAA